MDEETQKRAFNVLCTEVRELLNSRRKIVSRKDDDYVQMNSLEDVALKFGIVESPVVPA